MKINFTKTVFSRLFSYSIDPLHGLSSDHNLDDILSLASKIECTYFMGRNSSDFRDSFSDDTIFDGFRGRVNRRKLPISYILFVSATLVAIEPDLRSVFDEIAGRSGNCANFVYSVLSNIRANNVNGLTIRPVIDEEFLTFVKNYASNTIWDVEYLRLNRNVLRDMLLLLVSDSMINNYGCEPKELTYLPYNVKDISKLSSLDVKINGNLRTITAMPYNTLELVNNEIVDDKSLSYAIIFNTKILNSSNSRLDYTTFADGIICEINSSLLIDVVIDICRNGNPGNNDKDSTNLESKRNGFPNHPLGKLKFRKVKEVLLARCR